MKADRLKDNNDVQEWKPETWKFESGSPALERATMCNGRVEMKATDTSPPVHVQDLDAAVGYYCHST